MTGWEWAHPWLLGLLLWLPVIAWYCGCRKPRPAVVVPSMRPFQARSGRPRLRLAEVCMLAGSALLILALARPRCGEEQRLGRSEGIDIMLVLDLSGSMTYRDVPPGLSEEEIASALADGRLRTRVEIAREELRRFIEGRPDDRIGLVVFEDVALCLAPPTLDRQWLYAHLTNMQPGMLGSGATGIASGIAAGVNRLKDAPSPRRVLVLFSDGRNNVQNRITPEQAAALARAGDVVIHTVGIGSGRAITGAYSPGYGDSPVQDQFDESMLRHIATVTGGTYFVAEDCEGFRTAMEKINALEKVDMDHPRFIRYREYAGYFAMIALGLILLSALIERTWKLRLP